MLVLQELCCEFVVGELAKEGYTLDAITDFHVEYAKAAQDAGDEFMIVASEVWSCHTLVFLGKGYGSPFLCKVYPYVQCD